MFGAFALVIIIMLVLDLGFFRVQARKISGSLWRWPLADLSIGVKALPKLPNMLPLT